MKWTAPRIREFKKKNHGKALAVVTAYDATTARWCASAEVDLLLVGDSLGMVIQGHADTLTVTLSQMVYHTACVRRGAPDCFVVSDLPFGSYQADVRDGIKSSVALMRAGANMIKLEGAWIDLTRQLVQSGIPVMGHLGLTPQSINQLGGFRVQAREPEAARKLYEDALALEKAGVTAIVLESVPVPLAERVTKSLTIPTIGIGAGSVTDGQVLVIHDLLGMDGRFQPKFVKRFASLEEVAVKAIQQYCDEVRREAFPNERHVYGEA